MEQLYQSGEEIHVGDRIRYGGLPGRLSLSLIEASTRRISPRRIGRITVLDSWYRLLLMRWSCSTKQMKIWSF